MSIFVLWIDFQTLHTTKPYHQFQDSGICVAFEIERTNIELCQKYEWNEHYITDNDRHKSECKATAYDKPCIVCLFSAMKCERQSKIEGDNIDAWHCIQRLNVCMQILSKRKRYSYRSIGKGNFKSEIHGCCECVLSIYVDRPSVEESDKWKVKVEWLKCFDCHFRLHIQISEMSDPFHKSLWMVSAPKYLHLIEIEIKNLSFFSAALANNDALNSNLLGKFLIKDIESIFIFFPSVTFI